jgi:hypothetical protein
VGGVFYFHAYCFCFGTGAGEAWFAWLLSSRGDEG